MAELFDVGDKVKWRWGGGEAHGEVRAVFTHKVTRMIKGAEITRNATADEPAYEIVQADGDHVLKSQSEIDLDVVDYP